jgi:hypothetical protein
MKIEFEHGEYPTTLTDKNDTYRAEISEDQMKRYAEQLMSILKGGQCLV